MAGKRVHEVAKELKITTKQLMEELREMGIEVTSNFSAVDDSVVEKLKASRTEAKKKAVEKKSSSAAAVKPSAVSHKKETATKKPPTPKLSAETSKTSTTRGVRKKTGTPSPKEDDLSAKKAGTVLAEKGDQPIRRVDIHGGKDIVLKTETSEIVKEREDAIPSIASSAVSEEAERGVAPSETATVESGATPAPSVSGHPPERDALDHESAIKSSSAVEEVSPPTRLKRLRISSGITVREFAQKVGKTPAEIIRSLMKLGEMANINQSISDEAAHLLGEEFGYEVEVKSRFIEEVEEEAADLPEEMEPRPPVVTVMGHVDHGKTSLLDAIRSTDVISTEFGGITQHIGAYQVKHEGRTITFIDTPGHESFTALRARGAQVTDIAVLVVAADDGVMPQTVEAINHARAAGVPIIVAVNKIDKEEANPLRVRQELTEYQLVPEEWGGDTIFVDVSAKQKTNLDLLLDSILLLAELYELKARYDAPARGTVIEARLDKGRGPIATVLVQRGTLRTGDAVVAGTHYGRVRALFDERGNRVEEATPSTPVEVLGLDSVPDPGDLLKVVEDERKAKSIAEERKLKERLLSQQAEKPRHISLEDLFERISQGEVHELNVIIKGDVQGSVEALCDAIAKLDQDEVRINVIHRGVGGITENDVMLASASGAIIIGFNVRPDSKARDLAERERVDLRTYRVIYQVIEELEAAKAGLLAPQLEEVQTGYAQVQAIFKVPKVGTVGGAFMREGEINRNSNVRLVRDGAIVYDGRLSSLKRFKDDVRSVSAGYEFGFGLEGFQDIKEGDILEAYEIREKPRPTSSE